MEQLAHFVTKSFEYNNNRVLDVLNLATKSIICENLKGTESIETCSAVGSIEDDDSDSIDIDITDISSNDDNDRRAHNENDNNNLNVIKRYTSTPTPIAMKKSGKENGRHVTKNWLISDTPKRKDEGLYFLRHSFE